MTQLRFASHGIGVSWGDGTASPTDWALPDGEQGHCQRIDRHTYSLPGTYTITGRTWGVGAADQIIPMWQGQQTITVTKGISSKDTRVRLNGLMDGKTIGSWPGSLRWHQELSEPMALSFRLSTGGEKIAVMSKPVTAFTGYDGWPLRPDTEGAVRLEAAYKAGDGVAPLELTITGTSPSGEVVYKRQLNFKSDKNTTPVFHGCPGTYPTSPGGLTYTMRKGMNLNAPWMIDIDWYDGSKMYAYGPGKGADKAELPEGAELTGKMIDELHSEVAFTHTLAKPGTYKIRFSASNNTPENPPYSGNYCSLSYNAGLN